MLIKVKYKYGPKGQTPSVTTTESFTGDAKTESFVMEFLKKRYPNREIIILSIS